tara:strand:- start:332 stop:583 length:252 start_codon:yes stop_codon:yes gene_type:complete
LLIAHLAFAKPCLAHQRILVAAVRLISYAAITVGPLGDLPLVQAHTTGFLFGDAHRLVALDIDPALFQHRADIAFALVPARTN